MSLADDKAYYDDINHYTGVIAPQFRPVEFFDHTPQPFKVQIPFIEYFERIKKLKADAWQRDFANRLQSSVENRHIEATWAEYHAQAQLGKTVMLSQAFPSWCIGHDPLFRITLAMYNATRSQAHSGVVIQILQSQMHRDIFPNQDGWLTPTVSKEGWRTQARRDLNDGQHSFNPVGLMSGMVGSGFDYLILDDPYKEPKDAFSPTVWDNLDRFWQYGVLPRLSRYSCIAAMFHRYAYDDFGGYLLNTGKFDYVRYASIADGPYLHDETGQVFPDPLDRAEGELISPERFPRSYYDDKRLDGKVWNSMFQGRPSSVEGDFFKVAMIGEATEEEWAACKLRGRGWDHAATAGAGDRSAGGLMGMLPNGDVIVEDVFSAQLDSAKRIEKQRELAEQDGTDVVVVIPKDKAAAGKDVVYFTQQELKGFTVVARDVTNAAPGTDAKRRRAYNFSVAVNSGRVKFKKGSPWADRVKRLMRNFGAALSGDDEIDALSDVYNYLYEQKTTGLVVNFGQRHIAVSNGIRIPRHWTVYAGLKLSPEANTPNSGVIIARAAEDGEIGEALFILDEYKKYTSDHEDVFTWLGNALPQLCEKPKATIIWLHADSSDYLPTIGKKMPGFSVRLFDESPMAGITETNWYLQQDKMIALIQDSAQEFMPVNSYGLVGLRQEAPTWGFTDKGVPSGVGQVWDCVRMVAYRYRTLATPLTIAQKREKALPEQLQDPARIIEVHDQETAERMMVARQMAFAEMDRKERGSRQMASRYRPQVPKVGLRRVR